MKIHSDVLEQDDFYRALVDSYVAQEGVMIDKFKIEGSRKRAFGYVVHLDALPGRDRNGKNRRPVNSGTSGAGQNTAATYDEWGYWLAELFERDPDMITDYYKSREDFHNQTNNNYRIEVTNG
jgi:hypothetical protein